MSDLVDGTRRLRATGYLWTGLLYALDVATIALATLTAYYTRFEGAAPPPFAASIPMVAAAACVVYVALFSAFGLYRVLMRYVGVDTMLRIAAAVALGFALLVALDFIIPGTAGMRVAPVGVLVIQALIVLVTAAGSRASARVVLLMRARQTGGRRVLIVGAGSAGSLLLRELQNRPDLGLAAVGFLDDDASLRGRTIGGLPVIGSTSELRRAVAARNAEEVIVAMPSAPSETVRRILNEAADAGVATRITPPIVIAKGSVNVTDLRKVEVEDLLGREPTSIDIDQVAETIAGKVVAVTGAAGSIGSELCRQILQLHPERLVLIEVDESRLYELGLELTRIDPSVPAMSICDIRDAAKLDEVFETWKPQVVLHAAAYKHVPMMELNPDEAVKTNVMGTRHVIEASERHGSERFVLISTDKAVAPVNVMGLTKKLAEHVMLAAAERGRLLAVAVRFGNVLASRGSVVPIFENQLRHGGPITVTDPEVTRYFMTIPEAARLVLQAQAIGLTGDIFVLEMGEPIRIADLARKMIALSGAPADIEFIGLRPGEKLHEALVHEHESLETTTAPKVLRVACSAAALPDDPVFRPLAEAAIEGRDEQLTTLIRAMHPGS